MTLFLLVTFSVRLFPCALKRGDDVPIQITNAVKIILGGFPTLILQDSLDYVPNGLCGLRTVSKQAIIIRLQELGLVINETTAEIGWSRNQYAT